MLAGKERLAAGRSISTCEIEKLPQLLAEAENEGYDIVAGTVSHPRCCVNIDELAKKAHELSGGAGEQTPKHIIDQLLPQMTLQDTALPGSDWSSYFVGRISPWIDPDSGNPYIRLLSEKALQDELWYFAYLCVPAVWFRLRRSESPNLARLITEELTDNTQAAFALWVEVPISAPSSSVTANSQQNVARGPDVESGGSAELPVAAAAGDSEALKNGVDEGALSDRLPGDTWHWFYEFRRSCGSHRRIALILELAADLPDSPTDLARWKGEPLAAVKFDTRTFRTNRIGSPVLSRAHEKLAREFFVLNLRCLVDGPTLHSSRARPTATGRAARDQGHKPDDTFCRYFTYLNNLWQDNSTDRRIINGASGYEDCLQSPLNPLKDHLESAVYETFESDPVKYREYQRAFEQALVMKRQNLSPDQTVVVMVLGAGRGPLVSVSYETLKKTNLNFKLYALEKNPHALVTLNEKNETEWNNEVEVVYSDMRAFQSDEKADIVISELLGSFGDNELSPECLDGALHLMKEDCLSIPGSYRSYIAPIHSPKLYNEVRGVSAREKNPLVGFESPYVVHIFNYFEMASPKQLFRFDHPNYKRTTNDRYNQVDFIAKESSEMMGVAGYFYASLFQKTELSTVPRYETPGLFSWFPILFSLKTPVYVKKGQRIRVRFWRCFNAHQVWYEWQLAEPVVTPIMNSGGRSHAMRLY